MEASALALTRSALPPGPADHPLVTAFHWLREPLPYLESASQRYGDPFTMRLPGFPPLVFVRNPDTVAGVFQDNGETMLAGRFYQALRAFLGEHSVLMLDGAEHRRIRKLLLPPFHGERMLSYGQTMIDLTHEAIDQWPLRRRFVAYHEMQDITLKTIIRAIMGIDQGPSFDSFLRDLTKLTELASWPPLLMPFMQVDLGPWSPWGRFKRKKARVSRRLLEEIDRRRRAGTAGRIDVLSLLIAARDENGQPMTDDELRDELHTLLFAGHETTATSLAWALYHIHSSPAVEERLRVEIENDVGKDGRLAPERIAKLEYLDAVVRESLRIIPAAPVAGRVLDREAQVGGYTLPAGTAIVCSIYLSHRRADRYPEPHVFNPDRFLGTKFTPSEFFPFGGGIRRCVGMHFAIYEIKMVLATLMLRTRLRIDDPDVRIVRRITMKPSRGLRIRMEERKPWPV